jgi:hypothetical protein
MSDRYYLCPIVGTGTEANPYRAKVADASKVGSVSAAIKSNPDGKPTYRWTVARVEAVDFTAVEAMEGVTRLGSKSTMESPLTIGQKQELEDKLQEVGENLDAKDTTPRFLITRLIKRHYPHVVDVLQAFP